MFGVAVVSAKTNAGHNNNDTTKILLQNIAILILRNGTKKRIRVASQNCNYSRIRKHLQRAKRQHFVAIHFLLLLSIACAACSIIGLDILDLLSVAIAIAIKSAHQQ